MEKDFRILAMYLPQFYRTAENDPDVLEYYETWNEAEFPDMYRGGASLSRCG